MPTVLADEVKQEKRQRIKIFFDKPKPVVEVKLKDYSKIYHWYNLYDDRSLLIRLANEN